MVTKSSSHLMRSAALRNAAIAEGIHARKGGAVSGAIGGNQEEAGLTTGVLRAAMAVCGSKRTQLPAVVLLLIFVIGGAF